MYRTKMYQLQHKGWEKEMEISYCKSLPFYVNLYNFIRRQMVIN